MPRTDDYDPIMDELPPELAAEYRKEKRRQRISESMLQQSMQPITGEGRHSPLQGIAKLVQAYMGSRGMDEGDSRLADIGARGAQGRQEAYGAMTRAMQGTPEKVQELPADVMGPPQITPAVPGGPDAMIQAGMNSPYTQKIAQAMMLEKMKHAIPKTAEPFTLGPGQNRYGADGKMIASVEAKPEKQPSSVDEYNFAVKQGYKGSFTDWMKAKAQAIHVSSGDKPYFQYVSTPDGIVKLDTRGRNDPQLVNIGGKLIQKSEQDPTWQGKIAGAKESGKGAGDMNIKQYEAADAAKGNIAQIDQLITHIDKSDAITGMGADVLKNIERVKALMGSKVAAGKVADTEILDVMMGSEVFPMIKSLGIGARGMDTPAEREFMRKVLTGEISLNKDTIKRMAVMRKDIAQRTIDKWNSRVDKGELDNFFNSTGITRGRMDFGGGKTIIREVQLKDGRIGVEYSDGTRGYK